MQSITNDIRESVTKSVKSKSLSPILSSKCASAFVILLSMITIVVIVIICVITMLRRHQLAVYEEYVYGYWIGDSRFCEESGVSSMMLYIGEPSARKKSLLPGKVHRHAYIVINNDITNQPIEFTYCRQLPKLSIDKYKINTNIKFSEEIEIPSDVTMEFDILHGVMRMYNKSDSTMYGIFYKDHEVSNLKNMDDDNDQLDELDSDETLST
jgi:hypothetical protein